MSLLLQYNMLRASTAVAALYPVQEVYDALLTHFGQTPIPITNTRWWEQPVYPTVADSTETSIANLITVVNSAAPGDVHFLQNGVHGLNDAIFTSNGVTIAAETPGGCDVSESEFQNDGDDNNVMGFVDARYDVNGDDNVIAYAQRNATSGTDFVSDGNRNRFCYSTLQGKTADDQYFNVVNPTTAPVDNRIDHIRFLSHQSTSGGASEIGQFGQDQLGVAYRGLFDSNYILDFHTDPITGDRTNTGEAEIVTLKGDFCMVLGCALINCSNHINVRAGRQTAIMGNWIIANSGISAAGGIRTAGRDSIVAMNYGHTLNDGEFIGQSFVEVDGGETTGNREAGDRTEVAFNTAVGSGAVFNLNRSNRTLLPTDVEIHNNAFESRDVSNVVAENDSTTPNFGANVFGLNAGITDADVVEEVPEWTTTQGVEVPTSAGNLDATGDDISAMGPIIGALNTAGALYDILGSTIAITSPDIGAIQAGGNLTLDPIQAIIDRSGHAA